MRKLIFSKLSETFTLIRIENNIKEARNLEKAKNFYMKMLRKKLIRFLLIYKANQLFFEKNFESTREEFLKRIVYSKWFQAIPQFKEKNRKRNEYYNKIIKKFRLVL